MLLLSLMDEADTDAHADDEDDYNANEDNDTEERPAFLLFIAAGSGIGAAILGGMIIFGSKEED